jgi:hypothetical protein
MVGKNRRWQFRLVHAFAALTVACAMLACGVRIIIFGMAITGIWWCIHRRLYVEATTIVACVITLSIFGFGIDTQVRVSTGDQRLVFWGVPVAFSSLEGEYRDYVVRETRMSGSPEWVSLHDSNGTGNRASMVRSFYKDAALWAKESPELGGYILQDIADHLRSRKANSQLPKCVAVLGPPLVLGSGNDRSIAVGWRDSEIVQAYLREAEHRFARK